MDVRLLSPPALDENTPSTILVFSIDILNPEPFLRYCTGLGVLLFPHEDAPRLGQQADDCAAPHREEGRAGAQGLLTTQVLRRW